MSMRLTDQGTKFAIRISGSDRADLLHRITSNDVKGLPVGGSNDQCLLTARGKIIVPFRLECREEDLIAVGPAELKKAFLETIERYIFSEDVRMEDLGDRDGEPIDEDVRIRKGELLWGVDLDSNTIPWEAGMKSYVSTSKGCYTGQEVIARIETYGQAPNHLVRLVSPTRGVAGIVRHDGAEVGRISSSTVEPDAFGNHHALALVKKGIVPGMTLVGEDDRPWQVVE